MATAALRTPRVESSRLRRLLSARNLIVVTVAGVIAYLAAVPLGFLLWETFVKDGKLSVGAFRDAYTQVGLGRMVVNSLVFAIGSSALAIVLGTVLAYLIVRTDVPGKPLMFAASLVPLIIPGVLHTIAWAYFILSPQIGIGNTWFIEKLDGGHPFNVFSLPGMIFIEGLHLSPLVFLLMVASFRSMDPSLEESAIMSGASLATVFRRITVPLARPALYAAILIMVVRTLESFEVPAVVGMNNHIWVFTSRIWRSLDSLPPDYRTAGAYAMSLLVLTSVGVWWHSRLAKKARAFQTVTGKGFRPRPVALGVWKWPATAMIGVYFLVAVVLPILVLAYASTQPFYSPPSRYTLSNMSWENYSHVLHDPTVLHAFKNSIVLGLATSTVVMLVAAVAAWVVVRTKLRGRTLIDNLAFIPLIVPGLVLGVALLAIYLRTPWLPVYGTLWILFIAYLTRFMPYGMRYASTSMFQIGRELEESAAMSGAGWLATFRRVVLPLLVPGFVAGWIYILIVSVRELGSSVLLYSPGREVLSIVVWEYYRDGNLPYVGALGILMIGTLVVLVGIAYKLGARIGVREG
jgi:iron(III) transport system permease protein